MSAIVSDQRRVYMRETSQIRYQALRALVEIHGADFRRLYAEGYAARGGAPLPARTVVTIRHDAERGLIAMHRGEFDRLLGVGYRCRDLRHRVASYVQSPLMALVLAARMPLPIAPLLPLLERHIERAGSLRDLAQCMDGRCGLSAEGWERLIYRARKAECLSEPQADRLVTALGARLEDFWEVAS